MTSLPSLEVFDGDGSQDRVTIAMSSNGNLGLGETVSRLEFTQGDPSLDSEILNRVRFTGEVTDVNRALRSLRYVSALNFNSEEQGLDVVSGVVERQEYTMLQIGNFLLLCR